MKTKKIVNLLAIAGLSSSLLVACNSGGGNPNNPNTNSANANNSNAAPIANTSATISTTGGGNNFS